MIASCPTLLHLQGIRCQAGCSLSRSCPARERASDLCAPSSVALIYCTYKISTTVRRQSLGLPLNALAPCLLTHLVSGARFELPPCAAPRYPHIGRAALKSACMSLLSTSKLATDSSRCVLPCGLYRCCHFALLLKRGPALIAISTQHFNTHSRSSVQCIRLLSGYRVALPLQSIVQCARQRRRPGRYASDRTADWSSTNVYSSCPSWNRHSRGHHVPRLAREKQACSSHRACRPMLRACATLRDQDIVHLCRLLRFAGTCVRHYEPYAGPQR